MNLNVSWMLLLVIFLFAFVKAKIWKDCNQEIFTKALFFSSTIILGVYGLAFAITIMTANAFNMTIPFPSDDATLITVLMYGAVYSLLSLRKSP